MIPTLTDTVTVTPPNIGTTVEIIIIQTLRPLLPTSMAKISECSTTFLIPTNIGKNPDPGLGLGPYLCAGPMVEEARTPVPARTENQANHSLPITDPTPGTDPGFHSRERVGHVHQKDSMTSSQDKRDSRKRVTVTRPPLLLMRSTWTTSTGQVPPSRTPTSQPLTRIHSRTFSCSGGGPIRTHNQCRVSPYGTRTYLAHALLPHRQFLELLLGAPLLFRILFPTPWLLPLFQSLSRQLWVRKRRKI